jgi:hypothetical protein
VSHIVSIKTRVHDPVAIAAACRRLGLTEPVHGTARLYSGQATGLLLQLPGWKYPAVIDTVSGNVQFDNFAGRWGNQQHLDHFLQMYAVEKCRQEARQKGMQFQEQTLQDGSIKIQLAGGY